MKKMYTEIKIANYEDIGALARGFIKSDEVRSIEGKGRIDNGATNLFIPEDISKSLGLREIDETKVRYADGRVKRKKVGSVVEVEIKGRRTRVSPIIVDDGNEILIGNPIFEDLDFIINPKTGEILPNPESPDMPLAEAL